MQNVAFEHDLFIFFIDCYTDIVMVRSVSTMEAITQDFLKQIEF